MASMTSGSPRSPAPRRGRPPRRRRARRPPAGAGWPATVVVHSVLFTLVKH